MSGFDYERETVRGYRDPETARAYDDLSNARGGGLLGTMARAITRRERRAVAAALDHLGAGRRFAALLDVPCGAGKLAPVFHGRAARVVAADISPAMLERARLAFVAADVLADFQEVDAAALPFADASFDVVVCLRLLHRVPTAPRAAILAELARVTSHAVVASFGVVDGFGRFRLAVRSRILPGTPVPVPCSLEEARRAVRDAGLRILEERQILPALSSETLFLAEKR